MGLAQRVSAEPTPSRPPSSKVIKSLNIFSSLQLPGHCSFLRQPETESPDRGCCDQLKRMGVNINPAQLGRGLLQKFVTESGVKGMHSEVLSGCQHAPASFNFMQRPAMPFQRNRASDFTVDVLFELK